MGLAVFNHSAAANSAIALVLQSGDQRRGVAGVGTVSLVRVMRFVLVIVCATLLIGCHSPRSSGDETAQIASSLERRVTDAEARHILLDDIERAMQAARSANHDDSHRELEVLDKKRQRLTSKFESFLSHFQKDDQLWVYRTYVTSDRRGGESGFALVRNGWIAEHMGVMIYD